MLTHIRGWLHKSSAQFVVAAGILLGISTSLDAAEKMILPSSDEVSATEPLPIDGFWVAEGTNNRYRIDRGRMYAVSENITLGILRIEQNSVIVKDVVRVGDGSYSGYDLSLLGRWSAKLMDNRTLIVHVDGTLSGKSYSLAPLQIDDDTIFERELVSISRRETVSELPEKDAQSTPSLK